MKTIQNIIIGLAALLILVGGYFIGQRFAKPEFPQGTTLVSTAMLDSLKNLKPKIIVKDSIVWKDTTIYKTIPKPVPITAEINAYSDSIVNDSTWIVINDTIKGELLNREVQTKSMVKYTEKSVPYPVLIDNPVYLTSKPKTQFYGKVDMVGNKNTFLSGFELGIITKQNYSIGGGIITDFGNNKYGKISLGIIF